MISCLIKRYSHLGAVEPVLSDTQFTVDEGRITGLLGVSGVGKTTLLAVLLGTAPGNLDGRIEYLLDGRRALPAEARRRGVIGVLQQGTPLVPWINVNSNLLLPCRLNPVLREPSQNQISTCLERLNLCPGRVLGKFSHELSLGMRYRIAFARMVLYKPRFMLIDEAFSALDSANADDLADCLRAYVRRENAACAMVTHDIDRGLELSDALCYLGGPRRFEHLPEGIGRKELTERMRRDLATT